MPRGGITAAFWRPNYKQCLKSIGQMSKAQGDSPLHSYLRRGEAQGVAAGPQHTTATRPHHRDHITRRQHTPASTPPPHDRTKETQPPSSWVGLVRITPTRPHQRNTPPLLMGCLGSHHLDANLPFHQDDPSRAASENGFSIKSGCGFLPSR